MDDMSAMTEPVKSGQKGAASLIGITALASVISASFALLAVAESPVRGNIGPGFEFDLNDIPIPFLGISEDGLAGGRNIDKKMPSRKKASQEEIAEPRFIVRFEGAREAERSLRIFRENRAEAREAFNAWADERPAFNGMRLVGLTASGEAVLAFRGETDGKTREELVVEISARLTEDQGVVYADPDFYMPPKEDEPEDS